MGVKLVGEGGAEWEFDLPLSETYADQVAKGTLRPADDESAQALAGDGGDGPSDSGEKTIDEMSGKELDAFAAELGVDGWKPRSSVADKKMALKAAVEAKLAEAMSEPDGLDDLSDDDLRAKADEVGVEIDPEADRDAVLAAIREKQAE